MKRHWFGIEGGNNFPTHNLQPKVHEDHLLGAFTKDPPESACVQTVLKLVPVPLINCWIRIMKPYPEAIIDEAMEIQDNQGDILQYMCLFINFHIQVGDSRSRGHSHCNPADLFDNDVTKSHAVVEHHKFKGLQ